MNRIAGIEGTTVATARGEVSRRMRCLMAMFALVIGANAHAAYQDIDINCPAPNLTRTFAQKVGTPVAAIDEPIAVLNATSTVDWELAAGAGCSGSAPVFTCAGMTVTVPSGTVPATEKVTITGTPTAVATSSFTLTVAGGGNQCAVSYLVRAITDVGGWGDPHLTSVDGVNFDFQGVGEFTALREPGLEIQTRQSPVATAAVPVANAYTGLSSCVSIYTAFAAKVGSHRVTLQQDFAGAPSKSGMLLRIDGKFAIVPPEGLNLFAGYGGGGGGGGDLAAATASSRGGGGGKQPLVEGRIINTPTGGGIEIDYANGTQVVVVPAFWESQQRWYLNINVYKTTAISGTFGRTVDGWLPALPDGKSVGPKPADLHERYVSLNQTWADAWRVTDYSSLFDYAPGTSTATFTDRSWPAENAQSCLISEAPTAEPVEAAVAQEACKGVVDEDKRNNCVFDVQTTGNTQFAESYAQMEQLAPGATQTTLRDDRDPTAFKESVTFTATVVEAAARAQGVPAGAVQFVIDGNNAGEPVALDAKGVAKLSVASLDVGEHQVIAQFVSSSRFLASASAVEGHTVVKTIGIPRWVFIVIGVLVLIVLALLMRRARA